MPIEPITPGAAIGSEPVPVLPSARIQELTARLVEGFYDRTEVIDRVARAVARELKGLPR